MSEPTGGAGATKHAAMSVRSWIWIGFAMMISANAVRGFLGEVASWIVLAAGFVPMGIGAYVGWRNIAALPEAEREVAMKRARLRAPLLLLVVVAGTAIIVMFAAASPH